MSVFYPGQSVRISDLVSVALVLRVRSIEGNVLELEACDGSFYGFRHASSVAPECTPPAETSVPPLGAGLVAQPSVGGGECSLPVLPPPSETLWRFLTSGYGHSYVAALADGSSDKCGLVTRALHNWSQIRSELGLGC